MNRYITFILSFALLAVAVPAMASTYNGTLNTGIQTGISDIVDAGVSATPTPKKIYTSAQSVKLVAVGSDDIYYTTNGNDPSCAPIKGTKYTTGAITLSSSKTIRAVACFGTVASPVAKFAYGIKVSAPSGTNSGNTSSGGGGYTSTSTNTPLPGDINGDGVVNILDFNALLVQWGQTGPNLSADLNHDGVVGILDFNILIIHWNQTK